MNYGFSRTSAPAAICDGKQHVRAAMITRIGRLHSFQ